MTTCPIEEPHLCVYELDAKWQFVIDSLVSVILMMGNPTKYPGRTVPVSDTMQAWDQHIGPELYQQWLLSVEEDKNAIVN